MTGIERLADSIKADLEQLLPRQGKTQRGKLSLLVATMLEARSAKLMALAVVLPLESARTDMRDQGMARGLAPPLVETDAIAIMAPFARQVLERQGAGGGPVTLILDQSNGCDRHQGLLRAVRFGERARPLAWRGETMRRQMGRLACTHSGRFWTRSRPGCRPGHTSLSWAIGSTARPT